MAQVKVVVTDFGWSRVVHQLSLMDNSFTKVGFPENADVKKGRKEREGKKVATKMSEIAEIAAINEYGQKASKGQGRIPARPFMSTSFDENLNELNELKFKLYVRIVNDQMTVKQALSLIGEFMVNKTKKKIVALREPPNAPLTIELKKSSNPLIDTAQMLNSVTHVEVIK